MHFERRVILFIIEGEPSGVVLSPLLPIQVRVWCLLFSVITTRAIIPITGVISSEASLLQIYYWCIRADYFYEKTIEE